ncbi:MAG: Uma2 family endonuclease [Holophagales bacterium]|nr:Uma2 family endonuclease [Holophagales bacterium]MYF04468.1 Uma2 family endonuclease [Holophagales bacterium]
MSVTLLDQPPPTLQGTLGPYRRADHSALPDEPRCELILGRFYLSPSPVFLHQYLATHLASHLQKAARRSGGLAVAAPMDVHLADHTVVQPDVLYISRERRGIVRDWVEGPPDLVVEILSQSTASRDQVHKLNLYAETGVREYWIVDPSGRHVTFLVLTEKAFAVHTPKAGKWRSPTLAEIELDIDDLWAEIEREFGPPGGT